LPTSSSAPGKSVLEDRQAAGGRIAEVGVAAVIGCDTMGAFRGFDRSEHCCGALRRDADDGHGGAIRAGEVGVSKIRIIRDDVYPGAGPGVPKLRPGLEIKDAEPTLIAADEEKSARIV
jgi:hypothetical protein